MRHLLGNSDTIESATLVLFLDEDNCLAAMELMEGLGNSNMYTKMGEVSIDRRRMSDSKIN